MPLERIDVSEPLAPLLRRAAAEVQGSYAQQSIELDGPEDLLVLARLGWCPRGSAPRVQCPTADRR